MTLSPGGESYESLVGYNRALLNLLEDFAEERARHDAAYRAVLNVLEDISADREHLAQTQQAVLNILEDSSAEKGRLGEMQRALLNILQDLDEEKEKVEARSRELSRSNAELEQFAYVASHDLKEPLRMISSFTQLLELRYTEQLDDRARSYIFHVVDGARRMQTLINDLLAYSRVATRALPLTATDAGAALRDALLNLSRAIAEQQAEVTADELPLVMADRSQLVQLLQNLIDNGIKFRGADPPRVHVSARPSGEEWAFCVGDNGIGIDPQYFGRIFVIFQRLHGREEYPGTGIGLALCRRIVERHGGRLWVESEPGRGSSFFFSLPAVHRARSTKTETE